MSVPRLSAVLLNAAILVAGLSPATPALAQGAPAVPPAAAPRAAPAPPSARDESLPPSEAQAKAEMKKLGKTFEPHVYDGAGHGFLRAQEDRAGANLKATRSAWPRTVAFLREHLK